MHLQTTDCGQDFTCPTKTLILAINPNKMNYSYIVYFYFIFQGYFMNLNLHITVLHSIFNIITVFYGILRVKYTNVSIYTFLLYSLVITFFIKSTIVSAII